MKTSTYPLKRWQFITRQWFVFENVNEFSDTNEPNRLYMEGGHCPLDSFKWVWEWIIQIRLLNIHTAIKRHFWIYPFLFWLLMLHECELRWSRQCLNNTYIKNFMFWCVLYPAHAQGVRILSTQTASIRMLVNRNIRLVVNYPMGEFHAMLKFRFMRMYVKRNLSR